jgi:hypothetical protein
MIETRRHVFWHRTEVQTAIERLAQTESVPVLTGAGASAKAGFPLWPSLVADLLSRALVSDPRLKGNDSSRVELARRITAEGPIAAASYAHVLLGDRFDHVLADAVYASVASPANAGATAVAAAMLCMSLGPSSELATLNYDNQLSLAFDHIGVRTAKVMTTARAKRPGEVLIRHLHGHVSPKSVAESIVLTEADYYGKPSRPTQWNEKFMSQRLKDSSFLFVGTSLTDPNLLRYLHSQRRPLPARKHFAIFTVPADISVVASDAYETAAARKWHEVGVDPLHNDMYGQTAQFLHEIRLARELKDAYVPYSDRLDQWATSMKSWLYDFSEPSFSKSQTLIQSRLQDAVDTLLELLDGNGVRLGRDERLSIEIWSRLVEERSLLMLGSSRLRWAVSTDSMPSTPIVPGNEHPVMDSFMRGSRMVADLPGPERPWRSVLALPITLQDHPQFARLPVGVLTVCSSLPLQDSVLSRLRLEVPDADEVLAGRDGIGTGLLDPAAPG